MITDNEELGPKLFEVNERILKMCYHKYKRRLTCAELLSDYNQWGINDRELKHSKDYEVNINLVKTNKFFDHYLKSKLNV